MAERRMLLNSTESFVGTMRIEYYSEGNNLELNLNNNIKIIDSLSSDEGGDYVGYYTIGFKKDLIVLEDFINLTNYCEIKFYSDYNIIFDTRSIYVHYAEFHGNFTFNKQSIISNMIELYDYYYTFNHNCFNMYDYTGIIYFQGKMIYQYYRNNDWKICARPHILYDLMRYNDIEEGDEKAQNYVLFDNVLIISSPIKYITTIPNVDLGNNNYIQSVNNYMYNGNHITEYICNSNITHLRRGITLPKNATVYFPDTVTNIDSSAFTNESNLEKVVIFGNCKLTYLNGFNSSRYLKNIDIYSEKITDIENNCFQNCVRLTQFIISESVLKIGYNAFCNTNLESLYISKNVNNITSSILDYSENVKTIIVDENNSTYDSRNNCNAIIYDKKLIQGCKNTIIPNDIDTIGVSSFDHMNLTEIIIPNNITILESSAFIGNPISNIIIPESVIKIGVNCFDDTNIYNNENNWINGILYISNCIVSVKDNISGEVIILDNTRLICESAFYVLPDITKINIPNSLEYINNNAFYGIGDLTIEYDGTEEEWNNIVKGSYWNYNTNITYIFKT